YGEVLIPVLSGLPLVEDLSFTLGARRTENNLSGSADSWKINGDWRINQELRVRGGVQRAVRSPSVAELFAPQTPNFPNFSDQDPCNVGGPNSNNPEYGRSGPNGAQVQALCASQAGIAG